MKSKLLFTSALLAALLMVGCKDKNRPSSPNDDSGTSRESTTITEKHSGSGMYIGITGFSDNVKYCGSKDERYSVLTKSNLNQYTSFISSLSMGDATVLYYAVDNNLSYLQGCKFPDDLTSVNIVTFTDGLDQGSRGLDKQSEYTQDSKKYATEINNKIKNIKVQGFPINAYAIGIKGQDVQGDAVNTFKDNLKKLSSSDQNAMEVSSMDEVNAKFKEIAASLYKTTESYTLNITIPMPSENEKERFTFDIVTSASSSKCYLEGVYANGALTNITYVGCKSTSGTEVKEQGSGVKISFKFENFTDLEGKSISTTNMQQWHMDSGQSTWQRNSEFKPKESIQTTEEQKTAVVMLILDCSSSLGSDFNKVKEAASNFIRTLSGSADSSSGDNPGGGSNPTDNDEHCWEYTFTYNGLTFTYYGWLSEAEMKEVVEEVRKSSEYTNVSYRLASANDPDACFALNPEDDNLYIKHPWGTGYDEDWTWKQMTDQNDGTYTYSGRWGGTGANINTKASDTDALFFPRNSVNGYSSVSIGDMVTFTYNINTNTLSVAKTNSSSGSGGTAKVRFRKEKAYDYVTEMNIRQVPGGGTGSFVVAATYEFGTSAGTSPYYEINAQVSYPDYYNAYYNEYRFALGDENPEYTFEKGKKYTFSCGDDGEYLVFTITKDGSFNAPDKIVAKKRILKSQL